MANNPMGAMSGYEGDSGDENDAQGLQKCEQDIEDLESRVSAIEQKLGMSSPADEPDSKPVAGPMPSMKQPRKMGGAMPFLGVK